MDPLDALTKPTASKLLATRPLPAIGRGASRRSAAAILVVLLLSTGGFSVWSNRGPALDTRKVAVVPFRNLTGDSALGVVGRVAAEELSRSISQTDSVDVVSRTAIEAALGDAGVAATDAVQRVARATKAAVVVLGSYNRFGDSLRVQARLVNSRTGNLIRSLDPAVSPASDPMVAISALREQLVGSLVSRDVARRVVLTSKAPKYIAYLEYLEGSRVFMKNQTAALRFAERAIELDSTFVAAYGLLATIHVNANRFDDAERVVDRLDAQRQRLSSYERRQLEYLRAQNRYVADEALPLVQEIYARSADPDFAYLTGFWALRVLKADLALKALQIADSFETARGWVGQARDVALAHHQLGDYMAELAALKRGMRLVPAGATGYHRSRLRAFAGLGAALSSVALADTLLRRDSDPNAMEAANAVHSGARELEAHGSSNTARRLRAMTLDWLREHRTDSPTLARQRITAYVWFDLGNLDSASVYLQRAARDSGNAAVSAAGYLGVIAAMRGDSTRARAVADSLGGQARKWDQGLSTWWRAAILANLGQRDAAMQFLGESRRKGQSMADWHSHTALRPLRGYPPFEAMIKPQGSRSE